MTSSLMIEHVTRRFGTTVALNDVSLVAKPGRIHALLGENGAGKSTLMRVAGGLIAADRGTVSTGPASGDPNQRFEIRSTRDARKAGIGLVHQQLSSIGALTVAENLALHAGWHETGRGAERRASALVTTLQMPIDVSAFVETLPVRDRQWLEIAKALAAKPAVLLLDEPTASLAPADVSDVLRFLRERAQAGATIVLITHRLDEVFAVADEFTVLRAGHVVLSDMTAAHTPRTVSRAMIGGTPPVEVKSTANVGPVVVAATRLTLKRPRALRHHVLKQPAAIPRIRDATFTVRGGEFIGVAAVEGSGQRELLRMLAGIEDLEIATGVLQVNGRIGFVPEDSATEGVIPDFTISENLLLGRWRCSSWWIDQKSLRAESVRILAQHGVVGPGPDAPMSTYSGGNQQKLVLARVLEAEPALIVAENPTRGLDFGARLAVHARLRKAVDAGKAVVMYSPDLDEVLDLAHRVLVVARGRVTEFAATERTLIGDAMLAAS